MKTKFKVKCAILSEVWLNYRDDENFADFIEYGDLGLPLAYCFDSGYIPNSKETKKAKEFVEECFDLLIGSFGLEDEGFEDLDDIFVSGIEIGDV